MLKKKIGVAVLGGLLAVSVGFGVAFANGNIKIIVNGKQISSDVAPRMVNNRVMVPISFVSKALGANVSWDQKTQTVRINGKTSDNAEDIWKEELNLPSSSWAYVKNLIAVYIAGYDNRDDELVKSVVAEGFDENTYGKDVYTPIGGIYPGILDYKIVDAQSTENGLKVRVQVVSYLDVELEGEIWDFIISQRKIQSWKRVEYMKSIDSYTIFPGLTYKKQ
ncbi:copper amine oxidase N-terminal domain-containing protein [Paenibacillaceae bacterium]|nr:copper amine oxidase N-terminal domain-containing protein [Paenibacillaceae bacterium]